jgi:exodeoxyribonuclease-3
MRIITWNINSIRLRLGHVQSLIKTYAPDIFCLQETKCPDELFPHAAFDDLGYRHRHIWGMKGYNGVCILSKQPFESPQIYERCAKSDCRHISVKFPQFELHNLYIPSGGAGADEPDPFNNPKFQHKLDFVDELSDWFPARYNKADKLIAVGDFNIAPEENDVWSHKQCLKVISHTPQETDRLKRMRDRLHWIDTARHFIPEEEKNYTWWSYRNRDWKKSNRGRRLDHIWATNPLKANLKSYESLSHTRDFEKPSDHVPVIVDLAF